MGVSCFSGSFPRRGQPLNGLLLWKKQPWQVVLVDSWLSRRLWLNGAVFGWDMARSALISRGLLMTMVSFVVKL